jgi:hypothetical protein
MNRFTRDWHPPCPGFQCPEGHWFLFYLKGEETIAGSGIFGFSAPKGIGFFSTRGRWTKWSRGSSLRPFQCPEGHWFLFYGHVRLCVFDDRGSSGFSAPKGIGFFSTSGIGSRT